MSSDTPMSHEMPGLIDAEGRGMGQAWVDPAV